MFLWNSYFCTLGYFGWLYHFSAANITILKTVNTNMQKDNVQYHSMAHLFLTFNIFHCKYIVYTYLLDSIVSCQISKKLSSEKTNDQAKLSVLDFL